MGVGVMCPELVEGRMVAGFERLSQHRYQADFTFQDRGCVRYPFHNFGPMLSCKLCGAHFRR
jgi:hypothetical protein